MGHHLVLALPEKPNSCGDVLKEGGSSHLGNEIKPRRYADGELGQAVGGVRTPESLPRLLEGGSSHSGLG